MRKFFLTAAIVVGTMATATAQDSGAQDREWFGLAVAVYEKCPELQIKDGYGEAYIALLGSEAVTKSPEFANGYASLGTGDKVLSTEACLYAAGALEAVGIPFFAVQQ